MLPTSIPYIAFSIALLQMPPKKTSNNNPTGVLLGRAFAAWLQFGKVKGIKSVIDHYGDSNSYKQNDKKDVLMRLAWTALQSATPTPLKADVEALIIGGSLPLPESATIPPTAGPLNQPGPSNQSVPSNQPGTPTQLGPNASLFGAFTVDKVPLNPELDGGIQLTSSPFADKMASLLQKHFHRIPEPSVAPTIEEAPPPRKDISDDPSAIQLQDVYDNLHDPTITSVKLHFSNFLPHMYTLHSLGREYPFRGRGPVWHNNSCAFDCVIVAAQLLGIGRLRADTGSVPWNEWGQQGFQRDCLAAFHRRWDILTKAQSIAHRNAFATLAHSASGSLQPLGSFQQVGTLWDACTVMANQFNWQQFRRSFCTSCQHQTSLQPAPPSSGAAPVGKLERAIDIGFGQNMSMQQLLQANFAVPGPSIDHPDCTGPASGRRSVERRMRVVSSDGLPVRLVVRPPADQRNIRGSTNDNITFNYSTLESNILAGGDRAGQWEQGAIKQRKVTYRWLGGIYSRNKHFRVYWQDSDYATSSGGVKIYDGMRASGAIIGDIPPSAPEFKVPTYWSEGTELLFYEQINEDNRAQVMDEVNRISSETTAGRSKYGLMNNAAQTQGQSLVIPDNPGASTTVAPGTLTGGTLEYSTGTVQGPPTGTTSGQGPTTTNNPGTSTPIALGTLTGGTVEHSAGFAPGPPINITSGITTGTTSCTQLAGNKHELSSDSDDAGHQPPPRKQKTA